MVVVRASGGDAIVNARAVRQEHAVVSVEQLEYTAQDNIAPILLKRIDATGAYGEELSWGRLLIVDHDRTMSSALTARLEREGYDVEVCHSALVAAEVVLRHPPDLIILDVDMPIFTGLEFHECLQYAGRSRDIPVIYVSASDSATSRLVALRQGARAFLTKPYDPRRLLNIIDRILCAVPA